MICRYSMNKLTLAGLMAFGAGVALEIVASSGSTVMCNCPAMKAGEDVSVMCPCIAEPHLAATVLSSAAGFCAIVAGAILLVIATRLEKQRKANPS